MRAGHQFHYRICKDLRPKPHASNQLLHIPFLIFSGISTKSLEQIRPLYPKITTKARNPSKGSNKLKRGTSSSLPVPSRRCGSR
ncbi:hypothetical protein BDN72DRAFT_844666 [Pluteus cervinus]|uniref:Uncharacterized protein n=1 Tax=Pluteus cervinus TaxID=181527 RepID=A0ACD3AMP8_9AGAR|nr:hypothetical protein BDN72DRAFT_844666 [Pluteus cervinus]